MREQRLVGIDYLNAVTTLLQRVRLAHRTFGSYQAAELQFWWGVPRSTDAFEQLFWFDEQGRPAAAAIITDFGDGSSLLYEDPTLVVIVMPDSSPEWISQVVDRGLAHITHCGIEAVEIEVDRSDDVMHNVLFGHGFAVKGEGLVECWLDAQTRPEVSPLREGYRLLNRSDTMERPHHMAGPGRPDVEQRLLQTSLYRPDLDLVVVDGEDEPGAYGLFWHDPVTATGTVEPMRTLDDHQRRGLARHILTTGIELLADAGAERISIAFETDNPASSHLYLSVGFEPNRRTDVLALDRRNGSA